MKSRAQEREKEVLVPQKRLNFAGNSGKKEGIKMKKRALWLLAVIMALPLCACSSDKRVELTAENLTDYLQISVEVVDCQVNKDRTELFGMPLMDISGKAEIEISTMVQSDVQFENVELTLRVQPSNLDWQFERGNQQRVNRYDQTVNSKQIQISLPFDGETTVSDRLELVTERKMGNFELSNVGWEIIDVSGYAIEK